MTKMMNRIVAIVLVVVFSFVVGFVSDGTIGAQKAYAATWSFDESTGELHLSSDTLDYSPNGNGGGGPHPEWTYTINGTAYAPLIKTVYVDEGVAYVGDYAFGYVNPWTSYQRMTNLKTAYIAETVTEIGDYGFRAVADDVYVYGDNVLLGDNWVSSSATIHCHKGSTAETYAKNHSIPYVLMCKQHEIEIQNEKEASCLAEGYTGDKVCTVCGETVETGVVIPKAPHILSLVDEQHATCMAQGSTAYYRCGVCGKAFSDYEGTTEIEENSWIVPTDPNAHDEEVIITPATLTRNGSVLKKCKLCGEELDNTPIYAPTEIRLEQDAFDYTGGAIEPAVSVVDSNGDTVDPKHYTVSYSDNVNAGKATATVAFDGSYYTGTKELPFQINAPKNGWQQEDGYWYYYDDGNRVTNAWKKDSKGWRYLGADGTTVANSWVKASKGWCWLDANGYWASNRWVKDKDSWYYIKSDGYMAANQWVKASGGWCYVSASGRMIDNGWVKDSKGWCWMGSDGYWVKNRWVKDKGLWYYINSSGYMAANQWVKSGGHWYYMKANGVMAFSEWVQSSGQWYYLKADGIMATGTQTIGGRTYRFDSSGRWIK